MDQIRIIIRDDNYIRIQTPLSFAYDYARRGMRVDVLFLNMALLALTSRGAESLTVDGRHASDEMWLRRRLSAVGVPADMRDWLHVIRTAGDVSFHGCRDTAEVLGVVEDDLLPDASGLVDSAEFIREAVDGGVHCMYF